MSAPANFAPRVLLAASFPSDYLQGTLVPKLRAHGADVVDVKSVRWRGEIRKDRCDVVAFMFEYCGHKDQDWYKEACSAAGVQFMLLSRKSADWLPAFARAGIRLSGTPVAPALPLPSANGKPLLPPPRPVEPEPEEASPAAPVTVTFGQALKAAREADRQSQDSVAAAIGTNQEMVSRWEHDVPVQRRHYDALLELYPSLKAVPPPPFARAMKPREPSPVVSVTPVELPLPAKATNGHKATPPPLAGLLRAARALGIEGKLTVEVDDGASVVRVGDKAWHGTSPDAAVETARASLDKRLAEAMRRMEEQRIAMAAAMAEIGGAV